MSPSGLLEVEVRYLDERGASVTASLVKVDGALVVRGGPVRSFPSYKGQRNYPGLLWCATTRSLIGYESLLERDRLWLADFDPQVSGILSQPFWLSGRDGSDLRHHVPDFMLASPDGTYTVVDVKPGDLVDEPSVAEVFDWTRRLCTAKGWRYEVWSGGDPVLLRNLRFLAAGRRPTWLNQATVDRVRAAGSPGLTLAQIEHRVEGPRDDIRVAALALLWSGTWTTDLSTPLSAQSVVRTVERAA